MTAVPSRRIALDRRICVIRPDSVSIRPASSAIFFPAIGFLSSIALFAVIALFSDDLSVGLLAGILIPSILIFPLSAMGLFYSLFGNRVIIEAKKQSATFQQGAMGLGLGIVELVPFWKVERIVIEEVELGEAEVRGLRPAVDLRAFAVVLLKTSGKRLSLGEVITPDEGDLLAEAFGRAKEVAESIAGIMGKVVEVRIEMETDGSSLGEPASSNATHDQRPSVI